MKNQESVMLLKRMELFRDRLKSMIIPDFIPMKAMFAKTDKDVGFAEARNLEYQEISEGQKWGAQWDYAWFDLYGVVPKEWKGKELVARIDLTGEGLIFNEDGIPFQSVTSGSVFDADYNKDICYLIKKCEGGENIRLWVEAVGNGLFGVIRNPNAASDDQLRHGTFEAIVRTSRLCSFDRSIYELWLDMEILCNFANIPTAGSVRRGRIIRAGNEAIDAFAENRLNAGLARQILKVELERGAGDLDLATCAVGHAHIDTGWLWRVREGVRKCGRTFASQVSLLKKYPSYVFGASQAQHYLFAKKHYPQIYKDIVKFVKEGRWEIQGAMWVEADCNLTSGESLVRQILHGKNFFMDEFGVDVRNLWLPDVFGYSAALPQILKKSGVDFFVTQKLSWSQFNKFPHTTFVWRGIDGSEVITHFPPENTYNSALTPKGLVEARENFRENDYLDEFLTLFGIGDGGGGPKEEYIERGLRLANANGAPKVRFGKAQDFLDNLAKHKDKLPRWVGELYLELHRGTYTTQSRAKRGNRKLEQRLRMTEFICSCMSLDKYPARELDEIWKTLLINQFHDILPGSSIHAVYQDTWRQHDDCIKKCDELMKEASTTIFSEDDQCLVVANCLSTRFFGAVELPAEVNSGLIGEDGNVVKVQSEGDKAVALLDIPGNSFVTLKKSGEAQKILSPVGDESLTLENDLIRYNFNADGTLSEAYDKECSRDALAGKGNIFTLYNDIPNNWDAWDIDFHYERSAIGNARPVKAEHLVSGPVRSALRFTLEIGNSLIIQDVFLSSSSKRLDFKTKVFWKERHKMLRVSFPVRVESDQAIYEIQYGYLKRPTHRNTSWDFAKFEVVAHRYADLSETDYGVALLNDCKYGHKILDNILDLNLLRSPTEPDPDADIGEHEFTYSLLPHKAAFLESDVIAEAASLNMGLAIFDNCSAKNITPPCRIAEGSDSISIEVLKRAEKEDCLVIRLVECKGRNAKATLEFSDTKFLLVECDIMEWQNIGKPIPCNAPIKITMKPFEIKTFKIIKQKL